jgi:hypothetical protein
MTEQRAQDPAGLADWLQARGAGGADAAARVWARAVMAYPTDAEPWARLAGCLLTGQPGRAATRALRCAQAAVAIGRPGAPQPLCFSVRDGTDPCARRQGPKRVLWTGCCWPRRC